MILLEKRHRRLVFVKVLEMNTVVIPSFRASNSILAVIDRIGPEVGLIVVVDDCCPDCTGEFVKTACNDPRVIVVRHSTNLGVGGAFLTGLKIAIERGSEIVVKLDADGQMDPALIPGLIWPIRNGVADYVKGNRFFFLSNAESMPALRLFGNLCLSFFAKISSGYWNIMDPTNGFFAIHFEIAKLLRHDKIAHRFFFESDLLYHLGLLSAKVIDFPMKAVYGGERSNLSVTKVIWPFFIGNLKNVGKRIVYRYFLRDFSVASIELLAGAFLFSFGFIFGFYHWATAAMAGEFTATGTIMVSVVSLLIGFQLILAFLNYDINSVPRQPLYPLLRLETIPPIAEEKSNKEN